MATVKSYNGAIWIQLIPDPPLPTAMPYAFGPGANFVRKEGFTHKFTPPTGKTAKSYGSFWEVFENSIFVSPTRIDLGVSADASTWNIDMWHTHLGVVTVSDILQKGTRGMSLTRADGGIKDAIPWNGQVQYTVHIGLQTDTQIEASYDWSLIPSMMGAKLQITGSRVVPWPYLPQGSFTETREWLTDVIRTRKKEQRLSLRRGPRKTVTHAYTLEHNDLSNMWSHDTVWVNQTYAVPDWTKFMRLGPVTQGTSELDIRAAELGLKAKGFAFIYEDNNKFEVRPIKAVQANKVIFIDPITRNYNDATIVVIDLQKHQQPLSIVRTAMGVSVAQATWEKLDDTLNASNPFPQYSGRPVVTDPIVMGGTRSSERFGYDMDRIDSQVGLYSDFQEYDWQTQTRAQLRWSCNDRAEFDRVRNFLDFCRGKQGEFFVPTWNYDFTLVNDIIAGAGLDIEANTVTLFFKPFHIMIEYVDGTRDYVKVTSASRGSTYDTLNTQPVLGAKPASEVSRICRMNLMRFDTDRFEFQHRDSGVIDISAPIVAVPED